MSMAPPTVRPSSTSMVRRARVITVDRPGMGLSDFQPGRKVLDWPADVAALADALGLNRFAVLGFSGGCPFALACAFRLPERVTVLGIVSGVVPDDLLGPGAARDPKIVQSQHMARDRPRMAHVVFTTLGLVSWFMPQMIVKQALAVFSPADQDLLCRVDFQPRFIA